MKRITIISFLISITLLFGAGTLFAATTPTPTGSANQLEQQINNLKERIASRVAQLKLVDKRGIMGNVTDVSDTQITVTDIQGDPRIIDVDELTKFSSPDSKGSFGISDIKKGETVGIIGLYNKESRHLLARWVDVANNPIVVSGAVLSIDKDNYTFEVAMVDGKQWNIDVETPTKSNSYTKSGGTVRSGFSKLTEGQRVLIVGFVDKTDSKKIVASRITVFPDLPPNPKIALVKQEDIAPVVSTGSGKKLTPITK
ncbi:MAG TPA: DUF5666 domain-containing protein [Patescibacteria group bacterium]